MNRMFYLSIVYDTYGYDRLDLAKRERLQELDEIVSNFRNKDEVLEAYLTEYDIDKTKGKLCIVYEDLDKKKKELRAYNLTGPEYKKQINSNLTYAHIIPIMYKNEKLMNMDDCLSKLKLELSKKSIRDSIFLDRNVTRKDKQQIIETNKKYLFETENEQEILRNTANDSEVVKTFLSRIKYASEDTKYFYYRSLMRICKLSIKEKKKVTNLKINAKELKNYLDKSELTESEKLEEEANDMESFYLNHDLDEVILNSPNSKEPIGSIEKRR